MKQLMLICLFPFLLTNTNGLEDSVKGIEERLTKLDESFQEIRSLVQDVGSICNGMATVADTVMNMKAEVEEMKTFGANINENRNWFTHCNDKNVKFMAEELEKLNNTDLKERVTVLEFQMDNVNEDITSIEDDILPVND